MLDWSNLGHERSHVDAATFSLQPNVSKSPSQTAEHASSSGRDKVNQSIGGGPGSRWVRPRLFDPSARCVREKQEFGTRVPWSLGSSFQSCCVSSPALLQRTESDIAPVEWRVT